MRYKSRTRALAGAALAATLGLAGLAFTASPAMAVEETDVVRVAGTTRYGTAADAATSAYPAGSANVVLASGEKFPDALAGGGLAGSLDAPILLTLEDSLPADTIAALAELGAETVTILGGTDAVSAAVEAELVALGYGTDRVAGLDRFETAADIATQLGGTTAVLANGLRFPDALAISPGAHALELPVLLTVADSLHEDAAAYIDANAVDTVIIVGGTAVVSQDIEDALEADGITVTRLAGDTRYESSIEIAEFHVTQGFTLDRVVMATGEEFADALAGGPYASVMGAPMVLTQTATLTPATAAFLAENCQEVDALSILGGTAAITQSVEDAAAAAAQCELVGDMGTVTSTASNPVLFDTDAGESLSADLTADTDATDTFFIDGAPATEAAFIAATSPGDTIILQDTDGDGNYDIHELTNNPVPQSGLVGAVGVDDNTLSIITAAGSVLETHTFGDLDDTYTVDGTAVSQAAFEAAVSLGDTVQTTDADTPADGDPETYALTNGSWDGVVGNITETAGVEVTFDADGVGDDPDLGADDTLFSVTQAEVTAGTQVLTIDGAAATYAQFETALTDGDTVVYSRTGGVETFALTNVEFSASFSGTTDENTNSGTDTIGYISGSVQDTFVYTGVTNYRVNGAIATQAEFETALDGAGSLDFGEAVSFNEDTGVLSITTATSFGPSPIADVTAVDDAGLDLSNDTFDIVTADGLVYFTDLPANFAEAGTTPRYFVNGTEVTAAVYEDYLVDIDADPTAAGDSFQVVVTALATEHRLTTDNTL